MAEYERSIPNLVPGEDYVLRVRSVNANGVPSGWNDSIILDVPNVAGLPPEGILPVDSASVSIIPGIRMLYIRFDPNTQNVLGGYNIYVSDVSGFTADESTLVKEVAPVTLTGVAQYRRDSDGSLQDMESTFLDGATPSFRTYYVKIRARAIGGQLSDPTDEFTATPGQVDDNTIESMVIDKLLAGNLDVAMTLNAGQIQTGSSGARFTLDSNNFIGKRSDESTWFNLARVAESATFTASDGSTLVLDATGVTGTTNGTTEVFKLDSTGLVAASATITGSIQSGSSITGSTISGGTITIGSGSSIFKADTNGIYLGNSTFGSAPFRVTPAGALTATNANITGAIDATSGSIGNLTVDNILTLSGTTGYIRTSSGGQRIEIGNTGSGSGIDKIGFYNGNSLQGEIKAGTTYLEFDATVGSAYAARVQGDSLELLGTIGQTRISGSVVGDNTSWDGLDPISANGTVEIEYGSVLLASFQRGRNATSEEHSIMGFGEVNDYLYYKKGGTESWSIVTGNQYGIGGGSSSSGLYSTSMQVGTGNNMESGFAFGTNFIYVDTSTALGKNTIMTLDDPEALVDGSPVLTASMFDLVEHKLWEYDEHPGYPIIGPLAEDLDAISPFLVNRGTDTEANVFLSGVNRKGMNALRDLALQEARQRIVDLEARITVLESQ